MFENIKFKYKCGNMLRLPDDSVIRIVSYTHIMQSNRYYYDAEFLYDSSNRGEKKISFEVNLLEGVTCTIIPYINYNNVWNELNG